MQLILVRHSITRGNVERRFIGSTDQPLLPEGEQLARRRAAVIDPVEHVFVSPMLRCRQTAQILWPETEHTVVPELRETDFGPMEGISGDELEADPAFQQWLADGCRGSMPGVEPPEECQCRAEKALEEIESLCRERGFEKVGVLTHGGTIMALLSGQIPPRQDQYRWLTPNCGGWKLQLEGGRLSVDGELEEL